MPSNSERKFLKRWVIEGRLTSRTPFRIGDGGTREGWTNEKTKKSVEISSIATDLNGRAYIPAPTLKGNLRSWANSLTQKESKALVESFFGSPDPNAENTVAGKYQFQDALFEELTDDFSSNNLPHWCDKRLIGVTASVVLSRKFRTAQDKKLFHQEFVPPGVTFKVCIIGNDYDSDAPAARDEEGLKNLLALLEGFNQDNGVTIGGESEALKGGWGRFTWDLTAVKCLDNEAIKDWLSSDEGKSWHEALVKIENLEPLKQEAKSRAVQMAQDASPRHHVSVKVELEVKENFIVNDPSKCGKAPLPDHTPLKSVDEKPLLPRTSIKGAVRSQAEKIIRTIGGYACYPDQQDKVCKPVNTVKEAKLLCLACKIFGASGWRSPFQCVPFIGTEVKEPKPQEFVAIDRFTGGGAEGRKFNANSFYRPILAGEFSLDLKALERINAGKEALGLLALTMRDLFEGDIRIGMGAAKGYGAIEARITKLAWATIGKIPATFLEGIDETDLASINSNSSLEGFRETKVGRFLSDCVGELENKIARHKSK
jgi:CRISPR/Cas system CSM-associated protein Csm3 (group 7 of RAMP superfamily)